MADEWRDVPGPTGISFVVDTTMYEGVKAFPGEVYRSLDEVVCPNLCYHYSTPVCAQRWLDVCEDPMYGHRDLVASLDEALPDLVASLLSDVRGQGPIQFTSLGPGDGAVDVHLLRGIGRELRLGGYCGLDFSFDLLRRTAHRLATADGLPHPLPVRLVCGDFTELESYPVVQCGTEGVRLFSLTGFTMGNYSEGQLLGSIRSLMQKQDYLLLDARLHRNGQLTQESLRHLPDSLEIAASYDLDTVRRFVFGPVEVATMASAEEVGIDIEASRSLTSVPNALNLVIFCSELNSTMRLTGEPVYRDRLDLAVTTLYSTSNLLSWFPSVGFRAVWHQDLGEVAFFLLKRA